LTGLNGAELISQFRRAANPYISSPFGFTRLCKILPSVLSFCDCWGQFR